MLSKLLPFCKLLIILGAVVTAVVDVDVIASSWIKPFHSLNSWKGLSSVIKHPITNISWRCDVIFTIAHWCVIHLSYGIGCGCGVVMMLISSVLFSFVHTFIVTCTTRYTFTNVCNLDVVMLLISLINLHSTQLSSTSKTINSRLSHQNSYVV